jgi:hypothetical protein
MSAYIPKQQTATNVFVMMACEAADRNGVGRALVCAVCEEESGERNVTDGSIELWNPDSVRFEPAFLDKYVHPANPAKPTTEQLCQAMSFGLMQIMGQVARERGYNSKFLTGLCDPATGLEFGCRQLAVCMRLGGGVPNDVLLHWNGGADLFYPSRVMDRMAKYSDLTASV